MTTLGEAYIAVKADMRPFTRDLKKEVEKVVKDAEGGIHKGLTDTLAKGAHDAGGKAAEEFGTEFEQKTKRRFGKSKEKQPWMVSVASSLASALDDGISALPMQVKAALAGGILLALPIVSGALATAVAGGLGAGFAVLGTLLAFQYDVVRKKATDVFGQLRMELADAASPFVATTLAGLELIKAAFESWRPLLDKIFLTASRYIEPLLRGVLGATGKILNVVAANINKISPFVDELGSDFDLLGGAVAKFLDLMINTGEDGRIAFHDLILLTAMLVINLGELINFMAKLYGETRKFIGALPFLGGLYTQLLDATDSAAQGADNYGLATSELTYDIDANVVATKKQQKAIMDSVKAMNDAYDAAFKLIDAEIAYEQAIDNVSESLKQNGKNFNITTKEGRQNLQAFEEALKSIHEKVIDELSQGKITAEQAQAEQDNLTAALYKQASAAGANTTALHAMFDQATQFGYIPQGNTDWLEAIQQGAKDAQKALADALAQARSLNSIGLPRVGTHRAFSEYAEGGIVNGPTPAIVGEAGPEVIIPLSKPGRAAQLAQDSGLLSMLGGGGGTSVYVFLGNEQLEPYMVKVVDRNNKAMGTAMSYGARGL